MPQEAARRGVSEESLREDVARWAGSDEDLEWQKREKQRLREGHERVWGTPPAEFS